MVTATAPVNTEHKAFASFEFKDGSPGEFTAIVSTPAVDRQGDVVLPTAFKSGQRVPLIIGHAWGDLPVGTGTVVPTANDVRLTGKFFTTDRAREAYGVLKGLGKLAEFSIGFRSLEHEYETRNKKRVRVIKQLDLFEVSIVLKGASVGTGLVDIKRDPLVDMQRWARTSVDDGPLSVKAMSKRGFDRVGDAINFKGGPALWPASLIESDDHAAARRPLEVMSAPRYSDVFMKWLRGLAQSASMYENPDEWAFARLESHEQKALSEGTDSAGGYLATPEMMAGIRARTAAASAVIPFATHIPTTRDRLRIRRYQEHASSPSVYNSAFVGGWVGETPAQSDNDPKFGTFEISLRKARATTVLSTDLAEDCPELVHSLIVNGGENLALVEDEGFILGDGSPTRVSGLFIGGSATVDVEGSTSNTISNTTGAGGSAPKIMDLVYSLPAQYARNARFIVRRSVEGQVRKLVDFANRPLWQSGPIQDAPVINSDFMPVEAEAAKVLIYGDLSGYYIVHGATISLTVLRERYADTGQIGINIIDRVGGALFNPDAIRFGVV